MALSTKTVDFIKYAVADKDVGTELTAAVDSVTKASHVIAAAIVATNVSQTTDFAGLAVGDLVIMIPAIAGSADFIGPVSTVGTLGQAAVVGNLYIALRAR